MARWIFEGTARAAKSGEDITLCDYRINDDAKAYIEKILNGREEVYIRVNIWDNGEVDFFEEVDVQGSKVADLPPEEEGMVEDGL